MVKTLIVTNDFPPRQGGIENFVFEIASRFDPADLVVYTSSKPNAAAYDAALAFEVVRSKSRTLLPGRTTVGRVCDLVRQHQIEAIWYGSSVPLGLMAKTVRRRSGVKRQVATSHSHEVWWAKLPGTRQAMHYLGENVDNLTYITQYTKDAISQALSPQAIDRMVRLSPAVSPQTFNPEVDPQPVFERYDLAGRPIILCVGRVVWRKGQDTLIKAMPRILQRQPEAVLLIVGTGPQSDHLKRLAYRLGLIDSVIITGGVPFEQLPSYFAAANVFAGPSRSRLGGLEVEGFGLVYLEAQASGVPAVVGNSGGTPEAVLDGQTGWLVNGKDPGEVAASIIQLLDDPDEAQAMGQAGHRWAQAQWDWGQRYDTLVTLLETQ
ncbi:MAG: glycosyltransferase family 4 protein [Micrococcales bacterium]|nr:glycosyltransferase family 4 protein [Micrococcales bacterium]